jgi:hypothetical protein
VRAYSESSEEARRARDLLEDWRGEGLVSTEQYQRMEQETVCELRRTNIFLRLVLFLFTLIIVGAAVGLFFMLFLRHAGDQTIGVFLLIFAALSYAAAEIAVSKAQLYRYGIEEALAACSVGFLCVGMPIAFPGQTGFLSPLAGVIASVWIWRRFGLPYAPLAAMIFIAWLAEDWTWSPEGLHLTVALFYAAGLATVAALRPRHRFTFLDSEFSIAEACLWLGIYLALNLQLSPLDLLRHWAVGSRPTSQYARLFYWTTWVLTWCLPPVVLARGLRLKDRFVIAAGAIATILTLVTNKSYLGWERHAWDPMLFGLFLAGVAILIRRWLARSADGIRHGFTAQRLSGKDKRWMNIGATTIGLAAPNILPAPAAQTADAGVQFGGGDSGGGGASSDF